MSNEEKILSMLTQIQFDMADMKKSIRRLEDKKLDAQSVKRQLETLDAMRHLLTKEEADAVAAAVGG